MDSSSNGQSEIPLSPAEILRGLQASIYRRRPIFGRIISKHGDKPLADYARDFLDINRHPSFEKRAPELIAIASELAGKRFSADVGRRLSEQLAAYPLISTIDHHAPIDHPFWVNTNIVFATTLAHAKDEKLKFLPVFSFAGVSQNNASGWPRGILFHGDQNDDHEFLRIPILPEKYKMRTVYGHGKYSAEELARAESFIRKKILSKQISLAHGERVIELFRDIFGNQEILEAGDLCEQISKINFRMWPMLFHPVKKKIPDLLYLEIESIVREALLRHHFDEPTLLHYVLFSPAMHRLLLQHFQNVHGTFSVREKWGTFLFWGRDEKGQRFRLEYKRKKLVNDEKKFSLELKPEPLRDALLQKKIFPSTMLNYLVVSLYYGMKCLGGFSQVNDLTNMKNSWIHVLTEMGEYKDIEAVARLQTKEFGGDGITLAYSCRGDKKLIQATGIDMILETHDTSYEHFIKRAKSVRLGEMIFPMLPEMYKVLYPSYQRDHRLISLTPDEIIKSMQLEKRLTYAAS